jgi:uncharacterized protein YecT (DUF1311 family)
MRTFFMTLLLAWAAHAPAAEPTCPTTLPQARLNQCYEAAAADAVKRLDQLLDELRQSLERKNWSYLKQSQALWEKSRALDCRVEASFIEGPVRDAVSAGCTEKRTRERMHELRYFLCPKYDLDGRCDAARRYE